MWQPPVAASIAFAALGLRSLGGFILSHDEKDDYVSYCWYGVSKLLDELSLFTADLLTTRLTVLASWEQLAAHFSSAER